MMIRSQLRQIARHGDRVSLGLLPTTRHFSASRAVAEGQGQDQPSGMLFCGIFFSPVHLVQTVRREAHHHGMPLCSYN